MVDISSLSPEQINRLLRWIGYGNPDGRFWFIGMEEGGSPTIDELVARADLWREVEDLAEAPRPWRDKFDLTRSVTSVWDGACRIVGFLSEEPDWIEKAYVRGYHAERLGRLGGETFLTEVLPLPKKDVNTWPYSTLWETKKEYESEVRPGRINMLRSANLSSKPEFTFCYGKSNWGYYREIFERREFAPLIDGEAEISIEDGSVVVLMLHFSAWGFTNNTLSEMLAALSDRLERHGGR